MEREAKKLASLLIVLIYGIIVNGRGVIYMNLNNIYNFKNSIKHFVNIDSVIFPEDISNFDKIEIC